jgi:hypothetical protein
MHYHRNYFVTTVSGTVGTDLPRMIQQGDVIRVRDSSLRANFIVATEYLQNMIWGGQVLARKGDTKCLVIEKPEDAPRDDNRDRLWINIQKCKILR